MSRGGKDPTADPTSCRPSSGDVPDKGGRGGSPWARRNTRLDRDVTRISRRPQFWRVAGLVCKIHGGSARREGRRADVGGSLDMPPSRPPSLVSYLPFFSLRLSAPPPFLPSFLLQCPSSLRGQAFPSFFLSSLCLIRQSFSSPHHPFLLFSSLLCSIRQALRGQAFSPSFLFFSPTWLPSVSLFLQVFAFLSSEVFVQIPVCGGLVDRYHSFPSSFPSVRQSFIFFNVFLS